MWKFVSSNSWKHQYCFTNDTKNVITEAGQTGIYDSDVVNSVLEEVDNRIVHHISDIISKGYSKIMVHTVDSDVVVILLGFMSEFMAANPSVEITVDFKTRSGRKYISINSIYFDLGSDICSSLPFFYSFTRADSTCSFLKQAKRDWFGKCLDFPLKEELNEKFRILSKCPKKDIVDDCHLLIQQFVAYIYLRKFDFIDLDELRCQMFVNSSSNNFRTLPLSKDALFQHLLQTSYQSGWVWRN